ncbi:hypothetical protein EVAR_67479_1 [Eumeta japonica]|uniref:BED-type domain-containing protein n=1 Tax=Eumeta variegata TaxID=151549 RepID=A0A4C1ZBC8_EUMVA|nr:hypothetical protein EVAR_67479_1 [Eumeta japonica]
MTSQITSIHSSSATVAPHCYVAGRQLRSIKVNHAASFPIELRNRRIIFFTLTFNHGDGGRRRPTHERLIAGDFVKHKKDSDTTSVWSYFLVVKDGNSAKCKRCPAILKTLGGSTKGLHTHLSSKHNIKVISASTSQDSENLNTATPPAKRKLDDYFTKSAEDILDDVLARIIALDGFPFRVFITSDELRKLLLARYTDLPKSAVTIQNRVMNYSEKNQKASLVPIYGSMTAENCLRILKERLSKFDISLETVMVAIVTDGPNVMIKIALPQMILIAVAVDYMDDNDDDDHLEDLDCLESVSTQALLRNQIKSIVKRLNSRDDTRKKKRDQDHKQVLSLRPETSEPQLTLKKKLQLEIDKSMKSPNPEVEVQNESGSVNSIRREMSLFENGGVRGYHLETAYKYLISIPPTNVEAERAFSAAAYVGNKLRSKLGSQTLDALIFLRLYFGNSK